VNAIAGTMATRFPAVYEWPSGKFNVIVAAFTRPVTPLQVAERLAQAPPGLAGVRNAAAPIQRVGPIDDPLTDDRAPVEWLTDQMIVRYAAAGGNGK